MSDSFLPSMRQMVARKLGEGGLSQGKIASLLGVTQASVSLYQRSSGRTRKKLELLGISREQAELYASLLAEDLKKNPVYAVNTLYSIWWNILGRGNLCAAHRAEYPSLAQCDVCLKAFESRGASRGGDAVEQVSTAVRMIEASSTFVKVMPEVSVNIALAQEGASTVQDVVAVPGRIVKVRGMPRSFMRPEPGASTHVAAILLVVMSREAKIRAAMNLRYDLKMASVLASLGLRPLSLDYGLGPRRDSDMIAQLREKLRSRADPVGTVIDPGGPGIEPSLYLFASDAVVVAQMGLTIARAYADQS